jgi:hypothetical protein
MDNRIDQKIRNILRDLRTAHQKSEQFYAKELVPGQPTVPTDIFAMGLAFDSEKRLLVELELAYAEKFPDQYIAEAIQSLNKERDNLTHRIRAYQNRQFPSQYRE